MGKVDCFTLPGLDLWINSSDHPPPHFHAERRDKWSIRVYFLLCREGELVCDTVYGNGPNSTERRTLLAQVLEHREALLREWEIKRCP